LCRYHRAEWAAHDARLRRPVGRRQVLDSIPSLLWPDDRSSGSTESRRGSSAFARWLNAPKGIAGAVQPDFGPVAIKWYYLRYLWGEADTTNDLSLVVIVQFGAFKIVFAGDLEVSG
jgi:hypothetical protein